MKLSVRLSNAGMMSIIGLVIAVLLLTDVSARREHVVVMPGMQTSPVVTDKVVTKEFVLVDDNGNERARVGMNDVNGPALQLFDKNHQQRAMLRLNKDDLAPGDRLRGTLHSRFADARVLLTVRDGVGLRLWKVLTLKDGACDIDEGLPADVRYGCVVEAQYADAPAAKGPLHLATRFFRVEPARRTVKVEVTGHLNEKDGVEVLRRCGVLYLN